MSSYEDWNQTVPVAGDEWKRIRKERKIIERRRSGKWVCRTWSATVEPAQEGLSCVELVSRRVAFRTRAKLEPFRSLCHGREPAMSSNSIPFVTFVAFCSNPLRFLLCLRFHSGPGDAR